MFNISTKGGYGLQIMMYLAKNQQKGYISAKEIAKVNGISAGYLAQIILLLKKAGLVKSKEGQGGGHCLTKNPNEISALAILESLEGNLALVKCNVLTGAKVCRDKKCLTRNVWQHFLGDIKKYFQNITLKDLLEWNS